MSKVTLIMQDKKLPLDTQTKIKKYLEFVWNKENKEDPENEKLIMDKLSSKLRNEFYLYTNVNILRSIPSFEIFSDETLVKLSSQMKKLRFSPEEHVYKVIIFLKSTTTFKILLCL